MKKIVGVKWFLFSKRSGFPNLNLYEKYKYGVGKSKITESEWKLICQGYYDITGEEYKLQTEELL